MVEDKDDKSNDSHQQARRQGSNDTEGSNKTRVERGSPDSGSKSRWGFRSWGKTKANRNALQANRESSAENEKGKEKVKEKPAKKMPVRRTEGLMVCRT